MEVRGSSLNMPNLRDRSKINIPSACIESCECQFESPVGVPRAKTNNGPIHVHAHPIDPPSAKSIISSLEPPSVVKSDIMVKALVSQC